MEFVRENEKWMILNALNAKITSITDVTGVAGLKQNVTDLNP